MITPVAAIIFATAMALSLSVEADSFFHAPNETLGAPGEGAKPEPAAGEADAAASTATSPTEAGDEPAAGP